LALTAAAGDTDVNQAATSWPATQRRSGLVDNGFCAVERIFSPFMEASSAFFSPEEALALP
jgi:hypothetical protein